MYNVRLSQLAEHDLEDIWLYTFNAWSYQQADKYQDELYEGVLRLAGDVNLGVAADHIRPGYRKYKVGRHLIFYLFSDRLRRRKSTNSVAIKDTAAPHCIEVSLKG